MNVRLLRRIQKRILAEPLQFQMGHWFTARGDWSDFIDGHAPEMIPNCGTAACIAGWAVTLDLHKKPSEVEVNSIEPRARRLLKLTLEQALRLFIINQWPQEFSGDWAILTPRQKARRAVQRIDYFIMTKGAE